MVQVRAKEYVLIALVLTAYALVETRWAISGMLCHRSALDSFFDSYENDVILEFAQYGFDCLANSSYCSNTTTNSTRTVVNGRVWDGNEEDEKLIPMLFDEQTTPKPSVKGIKIKISNKAITEIFEAEKRPTFEMLSCDEITKLFEDTDRRNFVLTEDGGRDMKRGMVVFRGNINHPVLGNIDCYLKEAKVESNDGRAYYAILNEREKHYKLKSNTKISARMLGECVTADVARIIIEATDDPAICDDEDDVENYADTDCKANKKLIEMIESQQDKTRGAFSFIRELLCMLSEIERKKFFVQDIHGKHISVSKNLTRVYINNVDNLAYHGSRNILSGSICKYDENCPEPSGKLWANTSANRIVYEKCSDPNPMCTDTSCVGFNSSIHICGVARWILQPLYSYFTRLQDRSRITNIMMSSMNSWSFLRRSATESCDKVTLYLSLYDKDMAMLRQSEKSGNSFHVGKAAPHPGKSFHVGPPKPK